MQLNLECHKKLTRTPGRGFCGMHLYKFYDVFHQLSKTSIFNLFLLGVELDEGFNNAWPNVCIPPVQKAERMGQLPLAYKLDDFKICYFISHQWDLRKSSALFG